MQGNMSPLQKNSADSGQKKERVSHGWTKLDKKIHYA